MSNIFVKSCMTIPTLFLSTMTLNKDKPLLKAQLFISVVQVSASYQQRVYCCNLTGIPMNEQEELLSPSLLRRFAAIFYDAWLIFALLLAVTGLMIALRLGIEGNHLAPKEHAISGLWRYPTFALQFLTLTHFYAYFWIKNGQTLGMQTWRIRIDNMQHQRISWKQAYIRLAVAALSIACAGLGFLWMYIDKNRYTWHDHASGTHLVLLPKTAK
jgi:uncharacterized RDD family membrane protein YckC